MRTILAALAAVTTLSACGSEPPPAPPLTPGQQYLKTIHEKLDGKVVIYDEKLTDTGLLVCSMIPRPWATHSAIVAAGASGLMSKQIPDPFNTAEVITTAAEQNLCPTVRYAKDAS